MSEGTHLKVRRALPVLALQLSVVAGDDVGAVARVGEGALSIGTAASNGLVLTDPTVSRFHVEVALEKGRIVVTDPGSTNGTRIGPVLLRGGRCELDSGGELVLGDTRLCVELVASGGAGAERCDGFGELRGSSAVMQRALGDLARVAQSEVSLLLQGESGTGKELAARAVHDEGARAHRSFVTVDCAAIAPSLVASALFGHERGAFTGADRRRIGAIEQAHGGTLFLDEVGELSLELQAMLLGVLERRSFQRVGGTELVRVDVRVICATHRDLRAAVNTGAFRLDLYYRLATVRVALPPLRERVEEIRPLLAHFLAELGDPRSPEDVLTHEQLVALERHPWPGNVRELRNFVSATLALGRPSLLDAPGLGAASPDDRSDGGDEGLYALDYKVAKRELLDRFERRYLERLLARVNGNVRAASREARVERNHLTELLRRHGLHPRGDA